MLNAGIGKSLIAVSIIVLVATAVLGATAEAGTGTISGTSFTQCVCFSATGAVVSCSGSYAVKRCSVDGQAILKGLGNVSKGPNATAAAYDLMLFLQNVLVSCVNKAGNSGAANGQPFIVTDVPIETTDLITNARIDKNGKAISDLIVTDETILNALFAAGAFNGTGITSISDLCPNKNWSARVLVEKMQALGRLFFQNDAGTCSLQTPFTDCTLGDAEAVQCFAPAGATVTAPFTYVGASGTPPCDILCHDDAGNVCPTPDGFPLP